LKVKDFAKLLSPQTLQKIQDNYSMALGVTLAIKDLEGQTLVPPSVHAKLWNLIKSNSRVQEVFAEQLRQSIEKSLRTGQIVIFERHPDCHAFLAPIYASGKIIAFFLSGLVRYGNPNMEIAERISATLHIDIDDYLDAFLSLPFFTRERLEASANLIRIIGSTIFSLEDQGSEIKEINVEIREENQKLNENLKKAHSKLVTSANLYKQIFDTVNDGIYLGDFDRGTFLEINQAGAQILGYKSPAQLIGNKVANCYVDPDHRNKFEEALRSHKQVSNWIAHIRLPDGREKFVETNATLIKEEQTGTTVIQGVFRDLGERQHRQL
jgi:PAS domain S-box-containing protein